MTTFSQLVDEMTTELIRPDLRKSGAVIDGGYIASSINQTIREVHTGKNGVKHTFDMNRIEIEITVPDGISNHYSWPIFDLNRFQSTEAVLFRTIGRYAKLRKPGSVTLNGRGPIEDLFYWYQSGSYMTFHGCGGAGSIIAWSAFYFPRSLKYHIGDATDPRWATYDSELETWTLREGTGKTEEELIELSTNWLLLRWTDMIREGVRAKVYKRLGDENRQRTSYSAYESLRVEMQAQEISQESVFYAS